MSHQTLSVREQADKAIRDQFYRDLQNPISRSQAANLLYEALDRIENDPEEHFRIGGVYWRLASVLGRFATPLLDAHEEPKHAAFIRRVHGVLAQDREGATA